MTVRCELCGDELDLVTNAVYQWIEGWAKLRNKGGPNAVAHPIRRQRFACGPCITARVPPEQGVLL